MRYFELSWLYYQCCLFVKQVSHVCQSSVVYTSASAVSLVYWLSSDINLLFVAVSGS